MELQNIQEEIIIAALPSRIFQFLTDAKKHSLLTDAECEMDAQVGAELNLFGGAITGSVIELVENKKVVWDWYCYVHGWPEDHMSRVIFELQESDGATKIFFTHEGIPSEAYDLVKEGWEERYWQPMKRLLEK